MISLYALCDGCKFAFVSHFTCPPLWVRGEVSTKPLARLNAQSWFSQPAHLRACLAHQTLVLEAFHIRTWLKLSLLLLFLLSQCNPESLHFSKIRPNTF